MILSETRPFPKFDWFLTIDRDGGYLGTSSHERLPEFTLLIPNRIFDSRQPTSQKY